MSTVSNSASTLADETRAKQGELARFFDSLTAKGADRAQINFAKMQLLNATLLAVNAIHAGKVAMDRKTDRELL